MTTAALFLATACGGASLGTGDGDKQNGPLKIGLLVPQSGTYKALGDDMKQGFELYVEQHGGRLGGREVEIVVADEGETADSGKAAAEKLVKQDRVLAVSGVVSRRRSTPPSPGSGTSKARAAPGGSTAAARPCSPGTCARSSRGPTP
ncbi:ABC transporter substrate-binding protein [Streptomyces sp. NPDC048340]|uniref:ABC transporter substrate-binding protein n=1 Tax=Streptomyces sp. NPDC048340 TaxID=3365537 RepID=UPI0037134EEA